MTTIVLFFMACVLGLWAGSQLAGRLRGRRQGK